MEIAYDPSTHLKIVQTLGEKKRAFIMKTQNLTILPIMALLVCCCLAYQGTILGWLGVKGSGHVVEEKREVNDITGVTLATMGTLFIKTGETESLFIEAEDNLLEHITTNVRNGTLKIDDAWDVYLRPTMPIKYHLTVTDLDTIKISSSGDVYAEIPDLEAGRFSVKISSSGNLNMGDLHADSITVRISSSGDMVTGKVQTDSLSVNISSSGDMTINEFIGDSLHVHLSSSGDLNIESGRVNRQDIKISSSGTYTAKHLESVEVEVNLSSNGKATIRVSDKLKATLSSSGDLYYAGNPTVNARTSSSGEIKIITNESI